MDVAEAKHLQQEPARTGRLASSTDQGSEAKEQTRRQQQLASQHGMSSSQSRDRDTSSHGSNPQVKPSGSRPGNTPIPEDSALPTLRIQTSVEDDWFDALD